MEKIDKHIIEVVRDEKDINDLLTLFQDRLMSLQSNNNSILFYTKKFFTNATVLRIVHNNSDISGFAAFYHNNVMTQEAFLSMIAISPMYEGQGGGSKLLNRVESICKRSGMKLIKLEVNRDNQRAIGFYLKNGYQVLQRGPKLLMKKELRQIINVTKSSMPSYEEYCEEIKSIWESVHLTNMGPIHNRLLGQVKDYLKVDNIEFFVNGHLALYCALKAMGLQGEIITTPFTFASTTNAIVQAGCTPVYCDIKDDYTIDEDKIEALITDKTVAILGVHVYGNICNVEKIQEIADRHGLKVIYDAAHAFGVEYKGKGIGSFGDASMFSFHATKVFHTIEGGCVTFKDETLREKLALQRNFGVHGEELECFGTNAKMNEFQAAMGICNLRHIDEELTLRKAVFERYVERLSGKEGLTLLKVHDEIKQNYAYFPVLIDKDKFGMNRDELCAKLAENDIFARKYFYPLVSENKEFGEDIADKTPIAKQISRNILCLPMYAHLSLADVDKICDIILE